MIYQRKYKEKINLFAYNILFSKLVKYQAKEALSKAKDLQSGNFAMSSMKEEVSFLFIKYFMNQ